MDAKFFKQAYEGRWYTITGCGGDLEDWIKGYNELLARECHASDIAWHKFMGKEYNEAFGLTGDNRYPDDLMFLCFPIDGINVGRLAMLKLQMCDRWFDDITDNNLAREGVDINDIFARWGETLKA